MPELRRAAHTVYSLHYHFVFTTKYRKPVLVGDIGREVRDLIREICRSQGIRPSIFIYPSTLTFQVRGTYSPSAERRCWLLARWLPLSLLGGRGWLTR